MSSAADSAEFEESPAPLISDHEAGDVALPTKLVRQTTPQVEVILLKGASQGPLVERMAWKSKEYTGKHELIDEDDRDVEEDDDDAPAQLASNHAAGDVPIPTRLGRQTTPQVEDMLSKEQRARVTGTTLAMATMKEEADVPDEDAPAPMPQDHAPGDVLKPVLGRQVTPTVRAMALDAPLVAVAAMDDAPAQMPQDHVPGDVLKPVLGRQITPACIIDAPPKEKICGMAPMVQDEDGADPDDDEKSTPRKTREDTPRPDELQDISDKLKQESTMGAILETERTGVSFEQEEETDPASRKLRIATPMPQVMQVVSDQLQMEATIESTAEGNDEATPRKTREDTPRPEDLQELSEKLKLELSIGAITEAEEKGVSFEQGEDTDPVPRKLRLGTPMPKAMQAVSDQLQTEVESMRGEGKGDEVVAELTPRKTREDTPRPEDLQGMSDKLKLESTVSVIAESEEKEVSFKQGEDTDSATRKLRMGTPMPKEMQAVADDLKEEQEEMDAVEEVSVKEDDKQTNRPVKKKEVAACPAAEAPAANNDWFGFRGFIPNLMRQLRSPPNFNSWAKKPTQRGK